MQGQTAAGDQGRPLAWQDEARVAEARRRVAALKAFYIHLTVAVAVLAVLFAINAATGGPWWVLWVVLGWGIGLGAHALTVFGRNSQVVENWEKRKVEEILRKP